MKPIVKDILKAVIVLASIALLSGILLGVIYPLTRLSAAEAEERAKQPLPNIYAADSYSGVSFTQSEYIYVDFCFTAEKSGETDAYVIVARGKGGYGGDVQMYVVIKGGKIVKLAKGTASETPGVSDAAFKESFYNQFYEKDVAALGKFTLSGDVDAASGATRSSTGILNAVNNAIKFYLGEIANA